MALQTVQSKNLQQITINPYDIFASRIGKEARQELQELDRLLVQFWTSHSIRPRVSSTGRGRRGMMIWEPSHQVYCRS